MQTKVPLYKTDKKTIFYDDIVKALRNVGLQIGDLVLVHSDVSTFGKLVNYDRNYILLHLVEALKEVVGDEGTLIIPTFTYSFCNNEIYDIDKSKSTVGALTEYFRKLDSVFRTINPIFSFAIWGKSKEDFLNISKDSFDEDSVFGIFHKKLGKIVFLGAPFQSCTYIHYVEQTFGIPYRYIKTFTGIIKSKNNEYKDSYTFNVRYLDKKAITDLSKIENYLLQSNFMKKVKVGNGEILCVEADILIKEGHKLLEENVYFFLKEKPK